MDESQQKIITVYEDDDILAINKPSGVIVNRADTARDEITVQDWAEAYLSIQEYRGQSDKVTKDIKGIREDVNEKGQQDWDAVNREAFYERSGIVHRLDKETSGILLIAKNPDSFVVLLRQFRERITKKTYIALAHGRVLPAEGEINAPVGRLPWNRKQFGIVAGGRESITKYKVLSNIKIKTANSREELSLLELYPQTGRTHQIRVHLKYIGHPIFADFLYAGRKTQRKDRQFLSRVFLHASKISFKHPKTGKEIELECPMPEELQAVINEMGEEMKADIQ